MRRTPNSDKHVMSCVVCFLDQNPISLEYLTRLLHMRGIETVTVQEASALQDSGIVRRLIFVADEQFLSLGRDLSRRSLKRRFPMAEFLVLGTKSPCGEDCVRLLGSSGFILYSDVKSSLVPALRAVCDGHLCHPQHVLEYFARYAAETREKKQRFTAREEEVIRLIGEGLSNKEIGAKLHITEKTVKFHASNLYFKLGIHDRASAVEMANSVASPEERRSIAGKVAVR